MNQKKLQETVLLLTQKPKGILAIDESISTCNKRFVALGIETTEENRRKYRQLLVTAPTIEQSVSGYILFDETIRQKTDDGILFSQVLQEKGIQVGIKVDTGTTALALCDNELITQGLDGLRERLIEYRDNFGASFAKWRAELHISDILPSDTAMLTNAHALARYAALCQEQGIVPIIEPEIMMTGSHSIERCYEVTAQNFDILFSELEAQHVWLPGVIIKSSMVIDGDSHNIQSDAQKVADMTVHCFLEHIPATVGGVVFLSGGQSPQRAEDNLRAVGILEASKKLPWEITFSFGRAIQQPTLEAWAKNPNDVATAQSLLVEYAHNNANASIGK